MQQQGLNCSSQPMGICVKTGLGRMVLPSSNCSCAKGVGPGRLSVPPIVWIVMAIGILLYTWISGFNELSEAWQAGLTGAFIMDLGNLFLVLNILAVIFLWGAGYEFSKRKRELEERRASLSCEQ